MLEESSAAMAEDLVRKTALVDQFFREKPSMGVFCVSKHSYNVDNYENWLLYYIIDT